MAEFSGKIVDAFYTNEDYTMVKIVYEGPSDTLVPFYIEVDEDNINWQEFLAEGWTQEKLIHSTAEFKRAQSLAFNIEVNTVAKELAEELIANVGLGRDEEGNILVVRTNVEFYENLISSNDDKDNLFKFKIWALQQDFVKDASKDIKSKIRKAKRITEGLAIVDSLLK